MKKKIYKYVSVAVIAVAMVVSFQMSRAESGKYASLNSIINMALAEDEMNPIREFAVTSFDPETGEWKQCCYRDPYATACIPYNC